MPLKKLIFSLCFAFVLLSVNGQSSSISQFEKKTFVKANDTLLYRIMYPENFSPEKQYPVVLFLHGAGERGIDNEKQLIHGSSLFENEESKANFPAIVIFPQCPRNDYWSNVKVNRTKQPIKFKFKNGGEPTKSLKLVMDLLDDFIQQPSTKKDQIYVMGLSMGGMGTFEILYRKPNTFAGAISICGGGNPKTVTNYASKTKLWVFHGAKDDIVNPNLSLEMVQSILKSGGTPNFTLYSNDNHNSWDSAFAEPNLLPWLFSNIKNQ